MTAGVTVASRWQVGQVCALLCQVPALVSWRWNGHFLNLKRKKKEVFSSFFFIFGLLPFGHWPNLRENILAKSLVGEWELVLKWNWNIISRQGGTKPMDIFQKEKQNPKNLDDKKYCPAIFFLCVWLFFIWWHAHRPYPLKVNPQQLTFQTR